jgi:major type 1 subunit fimbrin (pilin)
MSKKHLSKFAVIAAVSAVSQGAFAAAADTGNINFEGEITASICSISPKSQNMTVFLGKPTVNRFKAAGDKAQPADFTIDLLDCPAVAAGSPANVANVTFKGDGDMTAASGGKWLKISNAGQAGGVVAAKNVAIQILDSASTQVDLNTGKSGDYILGEGTNSLKFKAAYIATAVGVTAGPASSSATFQVDYK